MKVPLAVMLLLALCPVVSVYGKKDNSSLEREIKRAKKWSNDYMPLKATSLKPIDEFKVQVDLEWGWPGSWQENNHEMSYIGINQDHQGYNLVKYPIKKPRKTSMFIYLYYERTHIQVSVGKHITSRELYFSTPGNNGYFRLNRIDINKRDKTKRDFEFEWSHYQSENRLTPLLRNWIKRRERKFDLIDGYTLWENVGQPFAEGDKDSETYYLESEGVLTALPDKECQFTNTGENIMGFSQYGSIITVDGPESPPLNLTLEQISISASDKGKDNKRNFHFKFIDTNYRKVNKIRQILFEIRIGKDNYMKMWGPWQNHTPLEFSSNVKQAKIVLPDYPTYEVPAIQFRAMSIAYIGTSKKFSNIVTVVRPSAPENLTLVGILRSFTDTQQVNKRDFDFEIDKHYYPVNKIIKLRFQYRIYKLANFEKNTTEKWTEFNPDQDVDLDRLHVNVSLTDIMTSDINDQFLKIEFRAIAVGYVGVSDPSNIVFAEVPSSPRNLNYIYYGTDVECYTKGKCEMEFDFCMSRYKGTFEIIDYIIESNYYTYYDRKRNWKIDTVIPENSVHYKRQYIHFSQYSTYRVCARNDFGTSLPSNYLFVKSSQFKTYALNVSYARHPNDTKAINVKLFWEAFADKDIHNYIVQSNLFFERDTQPMKNEISVPSTVTTVEYKKNITFMRYESEKGSTRGFYLSEFRVIARKIDKTFIASSATTIIHFSYEEYAEKGGKLCGCMPEKKLLVEPKK